MAILNNLAKLAVKPLPRMISPNAHAVFDYMAVGAFFAASSWFWRYNKRAAIAATICGSAQLALCLVTDYPGGAQKIIHFGKRRKIDLGLAAMTAAMPEFLAFKDEPAKTFFATQGMLISAVSGLSIFPEEPERAERESRSTRTA